MPTDPDSRPPYFSRCVTGCHRRQYDTSENRHGRRGSRHPRWARFGRDAGRRAGCGPDGSSLREKARAWSGRCVLHRRGAPWRIDRRSVNAVCHRARRRTPAWSEPGSIETWPAVGPAHRERSARSADMSRVRPKTILGLLFVVPLLLAGLAMPADAHHSAKIEIHKSVCPADAANPYAQCHHIRLAGVPFRVAGVWRNTDANGVVIWTPGAGVKTITEDASVFNQYGKAYVYCQDITRRVVLYNATTTTGVISITTVAGTHVVCDWYNLD